MPLPLILASRSTSRATLLRAAGIDFESRSAGVDEAEVKASMLAEGAPPRDIADMLAELKARRVSGRAPQALVLGGDQVLVCEGRLYDKPRDLAEAAEHLRSLRGRRHELLSAAVICQGGAPVWRHVGRVELWMRPFSDAFLEGYLARYGEALLDTVGAYRAEAEGAQLFAQIRGDWFSVQGLPLLELLGFLRARGVCQE
jgi:septum formation protein